MKTYLKLMSGVLAVLTISSPTSLAANPNQSEDKPRPLVERLGAFAWPTAIIGGVVIAGLIWRRLILNNL